MYTGKPVRRNIDKYIAIHIHVYKRLFYKTIIISEEIVGIFFLQEQMERQNFRWNRNLSYRKTEIILKSKFQSSVTFVFILFIDQNEEIFELAYCSYLQFI